ncbi:MAG: Gfo/Idh/MocA family oxidoreductase [Lentisphaeria bacterium]|nr:Gfo/Idh/MocA family oxidoreductase [Lentisphaeria bacterium]
MTEKIRWGIIGTGMIARTFAKNLTDSTYGVKQAVGSRDLTKAQAFATENGIAKAHGSYEALYGDPTVDAVYVATPHPCHHQPVMAALAAGKHVLCEKPLGVTERECREMVAAANEAGMTLLEAFMYRVHPQTQLIQQVLGEGRIGRVCTIRSSFCYGLGDAYNVRTDLSLRGGGLYDVGCYCINFSRMAAGREPDDITAVWTLGEETRVDENLAAALHFPNGIVALFDVGVRSAGGVSAEILGTDGSLFIPKPWSPNSKHAEIELRLKGKPAEMLTVKDGGVSFQLEADHFAQVVAGDCEPLIPATNAIGNAVVMDKIWHRMHSG